MSLQLTRRRFNVAEYQQMAEAGILTDKDRVELIEGEIVEMSPIGWRHHARGLRLTELFGNAFRDEALISIQGPLLLDDGSEFQPDVVLLRLRSDKYKIDPPSVEDVLL